MGGQKQDRQRENQESWVDEGGESVEVEDQLTRGEVIMGSKECEVTNNMGDRL